MDSRLVRARVFPKKPLLLKDFLLDDLGSCSSNGFKSFPRKQCCSSVPFLHESNLKNRHPRKRNKSATESALSAFRSVFAAVKRLPFPAGLMSSGQENKKRLKYSLLPRSFSTLKRAGFWKRKSPARKEIQRWKSFDQLLKEDSISNPSSGSYRWPAAVSRIATAAECLSGDAPSDGNFDEAVTAEANDVVQKNKEAEVVATTDDVLMELTTTGDGGSVSTNSSTTPKKQWATEEKEQFSPMSVLDCPFDDDDEVSSPFQQRLARMEGTKKKLMQKIHMFESLAKLEPLNLETRFTSKIDHSDNESSMVDEKSISDIDEQHKYDKVEVNEDIERKTMELLHQINATTPSYNKNLNTLLLHFFEERLVSRQGCEPSFEEGLLQEAQDWIQGRAPPKETALEWEVEKNRQAYIRDMEKGGEWKTLDQEVMEMGLMLESEVLDALLGEVLVDILV